MLNHYFHVRALILNVELLPHLSLLCFSSVWRALELILEQTTPINICVLRGFIKTKKKKIFPFKLLVSSVLAPHSAAVSPAITAARGRVSWRAVKARASAVNVGNLSAVKYQSGSASQALFPSGGAKGEIELKSECIKHDSWRFSFFLFFFLPPPLQTN